MNLLFRFITGLSGAAVIITSAWFGGWYFAAALILIALAAQIEWYALLKKMGMPAWRVCGLAIGALLLVTPLWSLGFRLALIPLVLLIIWVPFSEMSRPVHSFCSTISGVFYPTALFSFLIYIREIGGDVTGFGLVFTVLFSVWMSDSSAFFAGRFLGKHPLAPTTSPNKTWEGYFGGILGPILLGFVIHWVLDAWITSPGLYHILMISVICGVATASGDLAESRFKRASGIGESGTILPGHGGLLDRFDGMVAAAPLAYLYVWAFF